MVYSKKQLEKMLLKKLKFEKEVGSHHIQYKALIHGTTMRTRLSHGNKGKDIDKWLQDQICKQIKVEKKFFQGLMDCPITLQDYVGELRLVFDGSIDRARGSVYDEKRKNRRAKDKRGKRK